MKNFWRIVLLGYLFGMFALSICIVAVAAGIVEDMGISLLALPIVCPVLLVLFRHFSKDAWGEILYGRGAFVRWSVIGALTGFLYTIRVLLEQQVDHFGIFGVVLLVVFLFVFWLIFFKGRGKA